MTMVFVGFHIEPEVLDVLEAHSELTERTRAGTIRAAIRHYLHDQAGSVDVSAPPSAEPAEIPEVEAEF